MEYASKVQTNGERWVKEEDRWVYGLNGWVILKCHTTLVFGSHMEFVVNL
jgi:hypothetical protein